MSAHDGVRKPAEAQLKAHEHAVGFSDALLGILNLGGGGGGGGGAAAAAVSAPARLMAIICLKNVQRRFWVARGSATLRVLADDEKARLRAALLAPAAFEEQDNAVAEQAAVLVAKVARADWPRSFPELFPSLLGACSAGASASAGAGGGGGGGGGAAAAERGARVLARATRTLHCCLKELASKRLLAARRKYAEADLFGKRFAIWPFFIHTFSVHLVGRR